MVADQFNLGVPWRIGLKRFRSQLADKGLLIRAEPDKADVALPGVPEVVVGAPGAQKPAKSGPNAQLDTVGVFPQYSAEIPLN